MAAEWFYSVNGQQTGPVEQHALREMLAAKTLSDGDLVFGPGLTEWTPAARALDASAGVGALSVAGAISGATRGGEASTLAYRGVETAATGLSHVAMDMLRKTKPWVRFAAVMLFIFAGIMLLLGITVSFTSGSRGMAGIPAVMGIAYVVLGAIYLIPGLLLNRYANSIGKLMVSQRMIDVEQALGAQKSFWRVIGIMIIVVIGLYALGIMFFVAKALHLF